MRIALQTAAYWPGVGGIETVARLLAEEFATLGHEPIVLTATPSDLEQESSIEVLRRPSFARSAEALRRADIVLMFGMRLRFLPLPVLLGKPTVVSHHTWYDEGMAAPLKRVASRFTRNIAASEALARELGAPATVIPSPYDDRLYSRRTGIERSRDLVFVGRLVSDKGLSLLIEALALLGRDGVRPRLSVIGSGPEESRCRAAAEASRVERQIEWLGRQVGDALAVALNRHRVLVVPSLWDEPFGVVALEGAACGCTVVGSSGGGLPEAIGPCGRTFVNGNAQALAEALKAVLSGDGKSAQVASDEHLRNHSRRAIARRYLEVLEGTAA
jgi:glycogen(starch) synthase